MPKMFYTSIIDKTLLLTTLKSFYKLHKLLKLSLQTLNLTFKTEQHHRKSDLYIRISWY